MSSRNVGTSSPPLRASAWGKAVGPPRVGAGDACATPRIALPFLRTGLPSICERRLTRAATRHRLALASKQGASCSHRGGALLHGVGSAKSGPHIVPLSSASRFRIDPNSTSPGREAHQGLHVKNEVDIVAPRGPERDGLVGVVADFDCDGGPVARLRSGVVHVFLAADGIRAVSYLFLSFLARTFLRPTSLNE